MYAPNMEHAIRLFYSKSELDNEDILDLFGISKTTLRRKKNEVLKVMAQKGVKSWIPHTVNTKVAFEVWGIDVDDYERRLKKLNQLKQQGVIK